MTLQIIRNAVISMLLERLVSRSKSPFGTMLYPEMARQYHHCFTRSSDLVRPKLVVSHKRLQLSIVNFFAVLHSHFQVAAQSSLPIILRSRSSSADRSVLTFVSSCATFSFFDREKSAWRASFKVLRSLSTLSNWPCLRMLSLCQLICPPSASRCFWAFNFAARIDVLA